MNVSVKVEASLKNENNIQNADKSASLTDCNQPPIAPTDTEMMTIPPVEKTFLCHVCSKQFKHKHHMSIHLKIHSSEKEYECGDCGRKFRQKSHLNQHKKIHSGRKGKETLSWSIAIK